ncbi:alcohol dehydrogenase catalytic domain-containing protein [Nakamurella endophytica]|uniref:Zinc-binding dehydrogenase n=1 Tax=Nakamurella endophytica TaxID=1748367 RepID=A0A917SRD8_9ACTN|nr:alcohol dehydrogenase catalytic domain-containing protein [Nakamurella endophytica]GGL93870.1 zinc-binding dehydrogenase [Nakamurella endophytica]
MKALVYRALGVAELTDLPVPTPGPGEVLLRVDAAGICRTDLEILAGNYSAIFPVVPGHEFAGTVVDLGAGVDPSWRNRQVAVDPLITCGHCRWCRAGRPNLCADFQAYGSERDGGLAEYVAVRTENLVNAEDLAPEVAALAEPLACAENGAARAGVGPADDVLIAGAGPIGLLMLTAFGVRGARVTVAEPQAQRRERAHRFGAAESFASVPEAVAARDGAGFDLVADVSGRPDVVQQCLGAIRKGGRLLLFGVCPPGSAVQLDPHDVYARELTVLGSFSVNGTLPAAVASLRDTTAPVAELITHRLPLDALPGAFDLVGAPDSLKVQLAPH